MKKIHGMRKVSQATKNIPESSYIQISFDTYDEEILAAVIPEDPSQPWKRYQSTKIIPVLNTNIFMTEFDIVEAVKRAYAKSQSPQALATIAETALRQRRAQDEHEKVRAEQLRVLEQQWKDGKIEAETFLSGNGIFDADIREGTVMYCEDCMDSGCANWRHQRYDIDKLMVPFLRTVHLKGYGTHWCCSGHAHQVGREYDTHIGFDRECAIEPPEYFMYAEPLSDYNGRTRIKAITPPRAYRQKVLVEDAQKILDRNLKVFGEWIDALPNLSENA